MTRIFLAALLSVAFYCPGFAEAPARSQKTTAGTDEPIRLFDGKTLKGWTTLDGKPVTKGWEVVNGDLVREGRGGHIVTEQEFENFELRFEWKIAERGNSGVKYKLKPFGGQLLGCEYQLYDDRGRTDSPSSTGSLYALYSPPKDKPLKPVGEFNTSRIIVRGEHVEHWLNGRKLVEAEIGSEDWNRKVSRSKFNKYPGFAATAKTKIMLQDHGGKIWFRSITLQPLSSPPDKSNTDSKESK